jgi:predicted glycogen debranching enzyme
VPALPIDECHEWLESDGLGGFASGTTSLVRTRRYHALLVAAAGSPSNRFLLVNGCDVRLLLGGTAWALSSHRFASGVLHPDGLQRLASFTAEPWPTWQWRIDDRTTVIQQLFMANGHALVVLRWRLLQPVNGATLVVAPMLSGRDPHGLHHENAEFDATAHVDCDRVEWRPYPALPAVVAASNGEYRHDFAWWRGFHYEQERLRGFPHVEDLAVPGSFSFDLGHEAVLVLAARGQGAPTRVSGLRAADLCQVLAGRELQRRLGYTPAVRRGDAYLVRRDGGRTVIAGYPWFTDWGRDTFIALRGLCLATGRLEEAQAILVQWAGTVSEGMLPNRFPEHGAQPDYNSVDASLWFVIAVHELLARKEVPDRDRLELLHAVSSILSGYAEGTRYGIGMDYDGLLRAGAPGVQLTWMDAKVGDHVVTPRTGKPVEVQALWINALRIGERLLPGGPPWPLRESWPQLIARAQESFVQRFWDPQRECLHDVVDVDHVHRTVDPSLRPNQVFAAGGLPFPVLDDARARLVVGMVERELWTPIGLRTLAPGDPRYRGRYEGGPVERDHAYHQGTAWPWLLGPFVQAWVRAHGNDANAKRRARQRFLAPLLERLGEPGIGHLPEIADGDPPHEARGCPFQAWSVGEALRLDLDVLA